MRMCLGCREMKEKSQLVRIVKSPDGEVSVDAIGKKPGRGAYLCRDSNCFKRVAKSGAISRALKTSISESILAHHILNN
ncbi:MAG: YlxR family protein [Oscillospiraceae bacterium]|nr:YlxR family protein [Oscillospiraceae bacterium]